MSYEKISGCRMNPKKNILEFKSHSNNDDAKPSWWAVRGDTFADKLARTFNVWCEGGWQSSAIKGALGNLRYAFVTFQKQRIESAGEEPDRYAEREKWEARHEKCQNYVNEHKEDLVALVIKKDTKPIYRVNIKGGGQVLSCGSYGRIRYTWGEGNLFTLKQYELMNLLRPDLKLTYELAVKQ